MDKILCLIGFCALLTVPGSFGSPDDGKLHMKADDIFNAGYADGYRQILSAGLSPRCKEIALNDLAAASLEAKSSMNCSGVVQNLEDIGAILGTALDSVGQLLTDLNTVINSVPMCWSDKSWYNIPGKIACVFTQFSAVWNAVKDFWNYKDYIMETVDVIEDYAACLESHKKAVSKNVEVVLAAAKLCR